MYLRCVTECYLFHDLHVFLSFQCWGMSNDRSNAHSIKRQNNSLLCPQYGISYNRKVSQFVDSENAKLIWYFYQPSWNSLFTIFGAKHLIFDGKRITYFSVLQLFKDTYFQGKSNSVHLIYTAVSL